MSEAEIIGIIIPFLESVGKSQNSNICCSVGDPDDAFLGFTYVPPSEDLVE